MNKKKTPLGGQGRHAGPKRPSSRRSGDRPTTTRKPFVPATQRPQSLTARHAGVSRTPAGASAIPHSEVEPGPFRVLIAVHRPRFRGRAERAAALIGWEVTTLLTKQDPIGQVARPPRPPDLLILSDDFGRQQRHYGIFRAVQGWRAQGMKLIGMVADCQATPEGFPDIVLEQLCDVCLPPPYKMADLRALFSRLYEQLRGQSAPPPRTATEAAVLDSEEA